MSEVTRLARGFPPATAEAWQALVAKTLGEAPAASLHARSAEGLPIAPLYPPAADAPPLLARPFDAERPWDLRARINCADPAEANHQALEELRGGAASLRVTLDPSGVAGVAVGSAEGLARVLDEVVLEVAPVALDAGFLAAKAADWLGAVAKASPGARLLLHMDPLSTLAEAGESPGPVESHLVSCATVGVRLAETYPHAQLFLASGRAAHEAGGGEALEIAFAASASLAYAKALTRAGMGVAEAFGRITLGLTADADYFISIAKLRAARRVWARLAGACGADAQARIEAASSRRMLTARDAWTNMIRLTAAGFAAAVGGADAVVLGAFTDAIGRPAALARRQSRNIQLILMEEAHVGRVADPAAGSGYVEALTEEIARAAWAKFQDIEAAGGVIKALESGLIARDVAATRSARPQPKIVGVTAFPPAKDEPAEVDTAVAEPVDAPSPHLPGPDTKCPALTPMRLSEVFEVQS